MKLPAVNLYAPLLGYIISYCSPCCEHFNSTEYKIPDLRGKALMGLNREARNSHRALSND